MKIHKHTLTGGDVTYEGNLNLSALSEVARCEIIRRELVSVDENSIVQVLTFALIKKNGSASVTCCADTQELALIQASLERANIETIDRSGYNIEESKDIEVITF